MNPVEELEFYSGLYPDKEVVVLKKQEFAKITIVDGEPVVSCDHYRETIFLGDNGYSHSTDYIADSYFFEVEDINAYSLVPKGKSYKTVKVTDISEVENLDGFIFHDDMVYKAFSYPMAYKGTKGVLNYTENIKEPHFFGVYYFDSPRMFTHQSVFRVSLPEEMEVNVRFFNLDSSRVIADKKTANGFTEYSWTLDSVENVELKNDSPAYRYFAPHMIVYIKSLEVEGKEIAFLNGPHDLHRWYYHFIENINKETSAELDSIAIAVTQNAKTDLEKVKNVFYWVQDNIKYIAFEDGLGAFVPRNAKDICNKRYGDCKDMASIMHQMLNIAGVRTNLTWIGTRDIPYNYTLVPTPHSDNHMILSYIDDGDKVYFIDGTSTFNQLGLPSSFIQGKEALINIDSVNFRIEKVPVVDAENNLMSDSVWLRLDGDKIYGTGIASVRGYYKQDFNHLLEGKDPATEKKILNSFFEKGNNKFEIDSFAIVNKGNRDADLKINYSFTLRDYVNINKDEIYLNLHLDRSYLKDKIEQDRKIDIERSFASLHSWCYILDLPEGYKVKSLPVNTEFTNDHFGFSLRYYEKNNQVFLEFSYLNDFLILSPDQFEEWNKMIGVIYSSFKKSIILIKNN